MLLFTTRWRKRTLRTSRTIITSVGDDIVYTVFADVYEEDDNFDDIDDEDDGGSEDEDDDEDFLS